MGEAHVFITDDTLRQELHRTIDSLLAQRDALRVELNAALDALREAPKPPWNFRPTIGWQGVYCDWHEAQLALVKGYNDT